LPPEPGFPNGDSTVNEAVKLLVWLVSDNSTSEVR
jgi:hypothetical protein